ncbi:hypothetical protein [Ferroacidibacillus organovorans]|uniref:hypothetical protein n=1 Tax=Ferroacidibacillus organovorans TaxID=1765683 RepID=UPI001E4CCF12|nr:hypothetical protein [Ferroacidibacillus organovorans]
MGDQRLMGAVNILSDGMIGTAFLGLMGSGIWHVGYIGLIFFALFLITWFLSLTIQTFPTRRFFHRLSTLHVSKKYNPALVEFILAGDAENGLKQPSVALEACEEIDRRMKFSMNTLLFVILGFLIISKNGFHVPFPSYLYPSIQGISGALLGVIYCFVIRGRVYRVKKAIHTM